ncbi:MAG: hypothetical protein HC831_07055 [Chloroflexia bacterium]|nr:hypothetical protein [Chloroflexia bacterium]
MKSLLPITLTICLVAGYFMPLAAQQPANLQEQVAEIMQLRRQNNYWKGLSPFRSYIKDSAQAMINAFLPYVTDSVENVRSLAYNAIAVSGQKSTQPTVRQQAVGILTDGCTDTEAALRKNIAGQLENFKKEDFTEDSKQKLTALLKQETTYFTHTIKLIGFLDMKEQIQPLKSLLVSDQIKDKTLQWDIRLTLARLEDDEQINYCVDFIRGTGLNDQVIYNLFPDLAYMRAKEAVDYMIEVLNRDSKDCFSPNPDNPVKITCAYRVMEYLAPIIKDFPLATDKDGELDVDNYQEALQVCRRWFQQNTDYEIGKSRF